MTRIQLTNGRIWIPPQIVMEKLRPRLGQARVLMQKHFPGARWVKGKWSIMATPLFIANTNHLFGTDFAIPKKELPKISFPFKMEPRQHQHEALSNSYHKEYFAYFMEPGLGKTKVDIDDSMILNRDKSLDSCLIICPKSVIPVWRREIKKHGHYEDWGIMWWNSDANPSRLEIDQNPGKPGAIRWFIVGVGSIRYDSCWNMIYKFMSTSYHAKVTIDESTTIKNIDAKRTDKAMILGSMASYRRILTGTPFADKPTDAYAQMMFLDTGIFNGWSYRSFQGHFCVMGGYKQREVLGYRNQAELAITVGQHSYTALKKDCLDLPPRIRIPREITPSKELRKAYKAIADEVLLSVGDETMVVDDVSKKIAKLRQLCGGWVLPTLEEDEDGKKINKKRKHYKLCEDKIKDLKQFVEECRDYQFIVWCYYRHEITEISSTLRDMGFKTAEYHGGVSINDRGIIEDKFEAGEYQAAVIQVDTGAMGLTLNAASIMYFYSNSTYLLPRMQAEERNYRDGQTKKTTIVDAVVMGTVDQSYFELLMAKKEISDVLMAAVKDPAAMKNLLYPEIPKGDWRYVRT